MPPGNYLTTDSLFRLSMCILLQRGFKLFIPFHNCMWSGELTKLSTYTNQAIIDKLKLSYFKAGLKISIVNLRVKVCDGVETYSLARVEKDAFPSRKPKFKSTTPAESSNLN